MKVRTKPKLGTDGECRPRGGEGAAVKRHRWVTHSALCRNRTRWTAAHGKTKVQSMFSKCCLQAAAAANHRRRISTSWDISMHALSQSTDHKKMAGGDSGTELCTREGTASSVGPWIVIPWGVVNSTVDGSHAREHPWHQVSPLNSDYLVRHHQRGQQIQAG